MPSAAWKLMRRLCSLAESLYISAQGLIYEGRPEGGLSAQKLEFARSRDEGHRIAKAPNFGVEAVGATAIIGAAAKQGTFSQAVLRAMTKVPTLEHDNNPT
jgi:malic enzyme